jgi:uncharacterized protein
MFGFSLQKLLLLAAIVAAVWYGFKFVSRLQEARELEAKRNGGKPKPAKGNRKAASRGQAETMVQCPVCKTYVAARGAGNCGRDDCPY